MELPNEPLSEREVEILRLVATGASNKEIAQALSISPNTVKVHLRNIFAKIGVVSRTEATLYAIRNGITPPGLSLPEASPAEGEGVVPESPLPVSTVSEGEALPVPVRRGVHLWALAGALLLILLAVGALIWNASRPTSLTPTPVGAQQGTPFVPPRWTALPALPEGRAGMAAIAFNERLYLFGGETATGISNDTLVYDPASQSWKALSGKPTAVTQIGAARLGEQIYLPGGMTSARRPTTALEVYSPLTDTWQTRSPLPQALAGYALTAFEGNLYLFGGWDGKSPSAAVYAYDPESDRWEERTPLPSPRAFAAAIAVEGRILLFGGSDGNKVLDEVWAYYPAREASGGTVWEALPAMPAPRAEMSAVGLINSIYLLGGISSGGAGNVPGWVFTPADGLWQTVESAPVPLGAQGALVAHGNYLHFFGGRDGQTLQREHLSYQALYTVAIPFILDNP